MSTLILKIIIDLLRISIFTVVTSALLISKSALISYGEEPIVYNSDAQTNPNSVNSCDPIRDRSASSINNNNLDKLEQTKQTNVVNRNTTSKLPERSFWWAAKQFDPFEGKLIQNWLTQPKKQQVNLIVNLQLWTLLDYFGRYRFVNQFGTVARKYGYGLNIINQKQQCLATYKYNAVSKPPKWELHLQQLGEDSLQLDKPEKQKSQIDNQTSDI